MHDDEMEQVIAAAHDALDEERPADARALLAPVLAAAEGALLAEALGLAAVAARAEGDEREARALSDRAIALASSPDLLADLLEDRAELELATRAPASAASFLERAITLRAPTAETWLALGEAHLRAGALEHADVSLARVGDDDTESAALATEMRADVALARPDARAARDGYARALEAWRALGDDEAVVRCLLGAARAAELADDTDGITAALRALEALDAEIEGRDDALDEVRSLLT